MTTKDDKNKLPWHLLMKYFTNELTQLVQVLDFGARKYGEANYKTVPNYEDRYLSALYRHLNAAVADPNSLDPDTGISHYAHVAVNALFLLQRATEKAEFAGLMSETNVKAHGCAATYPELHHDTWCTPLSEDFLKRVQELQKAQNEAKQQYKYPGSYEYVPQIATYPFNVPVNIVV